MKRAKKGPVQLEDLHDLKLLAVEATRPLELMPPLGTTVATATAPAAPHHDSKLIHVPMDCAAYNTEGLVVTGPVQMRWLQQLLERPRQFVLHVDGKHKLHHGGWVLMTVGTHRLRWDEHNLKLSTSFVPLMYQMCKQVESGSATTLGSAHMLLDSLNVACDTAHSASGSSRAQGSPITALRTSTRTSTPFLACHVCSATRTLLASCGRASTARKRGSTLMPWPGTRARYPPGHVRIDA